MAQIEETARVIGAIVAELRVDSPADVHFIQMKGAIPDYTYEEAQAAIGRRTPVAIRYGLFTWRVRARRRARTGRSRAFRTSTMRWFAMIGHSIPGVASCSAKPGLTRTEIMVMANSPYWAGDLTIHHGVLRDMLDVHTVHDVLNSSKFPATSSLNRSRLNASSASSPNPKPMRAAPFAENGIPCSRMMTSAIRDIRGVCSARS
jgi:cyanuric acid amidohydrolase